MSSPDASTTQQVGAPSASPKASPTVIQIKPSRGLFDLDLDSVWRYRELLYFLVWRDLKVRYKQAAIGAAWAIVQPLCAMLIFTAIFGYFARFPSDGTPYPLFVFAGMVAWNYFAEAFRRGATGLVDEADLVKKIYFPRLIVPLVAVISPLVDFAFAFVVLIGLMIWYGVMPGVNILFLPLFILLATLLALAAGLWLGPINVRFRDIKHTIPFVIQVWMFASPIVYPLTMVPNRYQMLYSLNPMVGVVEGFRWALLGKDGLHLQMGFADNPVLQATAISVVLVLVALVGGVVFFKRMERSFADLI